MQKNAWKVVEFEITSQIPFPTNLKPATRWNVAKLFAIFAALQCSEVCFVKACVHSTRCTSSAGLEAHHLLHSASVLAQQQLIGLSLKRTNVLFFSMTLIDSRLCDYTAHLPCTSVHLASCCLNQPHEKRYKGGAHAGSSECVRVFKNKFKCVQTVCSFALAIFA